MHGNTAQSLETTEMYVGSKKKAKKFERKIKLLYNTFATVIANIKNIVVDASSALIAVVAV